jgi:hypothetical protein
MRPAQAQRCARDADHPSIEIHAYCTYCFQGEDFEIAFEQLASRYEKPRTGGLSRGFRFRLGGTFDGLW